MSEKEKENLIEENLETEEKNKKGFLGTMKGLARDAATKSAEFVKVGYEKTRDKINDIKDTREFEKAILSALEKKTYLFQIKGSYNKGELNTIRAFRDTNNGFLFIPLDEPNLKLIKSKTNLITTSDSSEITILFIEDKAVEQIPLEINEEKKIEIQCLKAKFEFIKDPLEKQITNISNVVNQSVNVSAEHTGDINVISNIEIELDKFMDEVRNYKTRILSKERKAQEEAIKIIGPVKETIINGKKDQSILQNFLNLLAGFAPALAEVFKTFM
ncbi:MAG TPA: hypothetical protein GX708_20565 [Gallicola sp.]|nr:hypothetical protein [Gallicola sp.]